MHRSASPAAWECMEWWPCCVWVMKHWFFGRVLYLDVTCLMDPISWVLARPSCCRVTTLLCTVSQGYETLLMCSFAPNCIFVAKCNCIMRDTENSRPIRQFEASLWRSTFILWYRLPWVFLYVGTIWAITWSQHEVLCGMLLQWW